MINDNVFIFYCLSTLERGWKGRLLLGAQFLVVAAPQSQYLITCPITRVLQIAWSLKTAKMGEGGGGGVK